MRRLALVVAVQAVLVVAYLLLDPGQPAEPAFAVESLDVAAPDLRLQRLDASPVTHPEFGEGALLLHFWATWCPPCREELPGLLDAARRAQVPLLAVTDEPWETIAPYFGGNVPPEVVRDLTGQAARAYGVSGLPETFVVWGGRRITARMGGARDWTTRGAATFLRAPTAP